jgi:hypothetical protein
MGHVVTDEKDQSRTAVEIASSKNPVGNKGSQISGHGELFRDDPFSIGDAGRAVAQPFHQVFQWRKGTALVDFADFAGNRAPHAVGTQEDQSFFLAALGGICDDYAWLPVEARQKKVPTLANR